jgi:hypothetical protein
MGSGASIETLQAAETVEQAVVALKGVLCSKIPDGVECGKDSLAEILKIFAEHDESKRGFVTPKKFADICRSLIPEPSASATDDVWLQLAESTDTADSNRVYYERVIRWILEWGGDKTTTYYDFLVA